MTPNQNQAVWELLRQGLHRIADQAELAWEQGDRFAPDKRVPIAKPIEQLIDLGNWELRRQET
ncbi:MAG: hypothetical protein EA400_08620 [Chromatiaceae bacterium]|nr:MAG: hypothetical protein EA400_08620 [Chromatiaceae bacterium]